jgi:hypothetical protein
MNYPQRTEGQYAFERFRQKFSEVIRDLAGSPERSYFPDTVEQDAQQGAVVYMDAVGPKDPAQTMELTSKPTYRGFEDNSSKDFAAWNKIHTPFMNTEYQRTLSTPQLIEWGHFFDEDEQLLDVIDPTNRLLWAGMRSIFKARDELFLNALQAPTVQRVNGSSSNEVTPVGVSFPQEQQIQSAQADKFLVEDISHIRMIFEQNYVSDEMPMALISPRTKRMLIDLNDKIFDYNFVSRNSQWFETGELPEIYGVVFMVSPLVPDNKVLAYTRSGLVWNTAKGMNSDLSKVPLIREGTQAYIREKVDCKRIDDKKVVWMDIKTSASSSKKSA